VSVQIGKVIIYLHRGGRGREALSRRKGKKRKGRNARTAGGVKMKRRQRQGRASIRERGVRPWRENTDQGRGGKKILSMINFRREKLGKTNVDRWKGRRNKFCLKEGRLEVGVLQFYSARKEGITGWGGGFQGGPRVSGKKRGIKGEEKKEVWRITLVMGGLN